MKKILSLSLLFLLVFLGLVATAIAADCDYEIHCDVHCPKTVTAGNALNVTVSCDNNGSGSVSLNRGMVSLVGNAGGTIGGAGMYGPFNKNFTTPWNISWGGSATRNVNIVGTVPSQLAGTIALANFNLITSNGCVIAGGICLVQVVPVTP